MKRYIAAIFFIFQGLLLVAGDIEISATAPSKVGVGQSFHLRYTIKNHDARPSLPDLGNFRIVGGPATSTSQSVQIINNNVTRETTTTYTYTLQAQSTGNFTIPAASIVANGQTYRSNSVSIEVVEEAIADQAPSQRSTHPGFQHQQRQPQQRQQTPQQITDEDLFIRVHLNKSELYRGEGLRATIMLYTRIDIIGFEEFVPPAYNGFWSEDIQIPHRIDLQREVIDGQVYNVGVIKKNILFPRHSGELVIEPAILTCKIRQHVRGGQSLIDQFFGHYETMSKTVRSPEIRINVKDLPRNHGPEFRGAVGNYSFSAALSRDTIIVNEATDLKLTIEGNGNLRMLDHPGIIFPDEFETYDPQIINNFTARDNGVSGSKRWDFTIIPRYPGIYDLGRLKFEYFDLASEQFRTIKSDPIIIAVRQDEHDKDFAGTVFNYNRRSIDYIGDKDIRFIKIGNLNLKNVSKPLISSWKLGLMYLGALIFFAGFVVTKRKKIKENSNLALIKNKRANKISRKRMKKAAGFMKKNAKSDFYKEVITALWGYISDKLNIEIADLKREKAVAKLSEHGVEESDIEKLLDVIDKCEYAHFAPTSEETEISNIYLEAVSIIKTLEQKLR